MSQAIQILSDIWSYEKWKWKTLSHFQLFATPWTVQFFEFPKPEYWSR